MQYTAATSIQFEHGGAVTDTTTWHDQQVVKSSKFDLLQTEPRTVLLSRDCEPVRIFQPSLDAARS